MNKPNRITKNNEILNYTITSNCLPIIGEPVDEKIMINLFMFFKKADGKKYYLLQMFGNGSGVN